MAEDGGEEAEGEASGSVFTVTLVRDGVGEDMAEEGDLDEWGVRWNEAGLGRAGQGVAGGESDGRSDGGSAAQEALHLPSPDTRSTQGGHTPQTQRGRRRSTSEDRSDDEGREAALMRAERG